MTSMFRYLDAQDVEVRVAQCTERGVTLLLYKDARCDMRLLDGAVTPDKWQCRYDLIDNTLFCSIGIYSDVLNEWVWKSDCGVQSNIEAEKGAASDAFKRAGFRWGIGRELYTAPRIFVNAGNCSIKKNDRGRCACFDRFRVDEMVVENGRITKLRIVNDSRKGCVVFEWPTQDKPQQSQPKHANSALIAARERMSAACSGYATRHGSDIQSIKQGVRNRPDFADTIEFYEAVAAELESA